MDHAILLRHLAQAEAHVAEGDRHIARQREIVADLDRRGVNAASAHRTLALFEGMQRLHVENRNRLARAVSANSERLAPSS